jgi:hypothetical protein
MDPKSVKQMLSMLTMNFQLLTFLKLRDQNLRENAL